MNDRIAKCQIQAKSTLLTNLQYKIEQTKKYSNRIRHLAFPATVESGKWQQTERDRSNFECCCTMQPWKINNIYRNILD